MTVTITQGFSDIQGVVGTDTSTWADYSTWDSFTSWATTSNDVIITVLDDELTLAARTPTIEVDYDGELSITLETSTTGSFSGEQETINFVSGSTYSYSTARYYRWTITISADSLYTTPVFYGFEATYETDRVTEYLNDQDVYAAPVDSEGDSEITSNLAYIENVQATALQGGKYVEDGYIIPLQNAASGYVRTAKSITNVNGVSISSDEPRTDNPTSLKFIRANSTHLEVENPLPRYLNNTDSTTIEFWVNFSSLPTTGQSYYMMSIGDSDITSYDPPFLVFINEFHTITFQINSIEAGSLGCSTTTTFSAGTWYHLAFTYDPSTDEGKLYVDGTLEDTETFIGLAETIETGTQTDLYIGARRFDGGGGTSIDNKLNGYMDEIHISTGIKYTANFTPQDTIYTTTNTQLYIDGTAIEDAVLFDGGDVPYIIEQQGGSPVIESKNPLTVRVVDYNGTAWDGTIDMAIRGLPKVELTTDGVRAVAVE